MKLQIHYVITNNGDGSASIRLYDTAELTAWVEENTLLGTESGWAEDCRGVIEVESNSPMNVLTDIYTKYKLLIDYYKYIDSQDLLDDFIREFFPDGLPDFEIKNPVKFTSGMYDFKQKKVVDRDAYRFDICLEGEKVDHITSFASKLTPEDIMEELQKMFDNALEDY